MLHILRLDLDTFFRFDMNFRWLAMEKVVEFSE